MKYTIIWSKNYDQLWKLLLIEKEIYVYYNSLNQKYNNTGGKILDIMRVHHISFSDLNPILISLYMKEIQMTKLIFEKEEFILFCKDHDLEYMLPVIVEKNNELPIVIERRGEQEKKSSSTIIDYITNKWNPEFVEYITKEVEKINFIEIALKKNPYTYRKEDTMFIIYRYGYFYSLCYSDDEEVVKRKCEEYHKKDLKQITEIRL